MVWREELADEGPENPEWVQMWLETLDGLPEGHWSMVEEALEKSLRHIARTSANLDVRDGHSVDCYDGCVSNEPDASQECPVVGMTREAAQALWGRSEPEGLA